MGGENRVFLDKPASSGAEKEEPLDWDRRTASSESDPELCLVSIVLASSNDFSLSSSLPVTHNSYVSHCCSDNKTGETVSDAVHIEVGPGALRKSN